MTSLPNFNEVAKAIATIAHCRYCGIDGLRCPDDVIEQAGQIRLALQQAWLAGLKAGLIGLTIKGSVNPADE